MASPSSQPSDLIVSTFLEPLKCLGILHVHTSLPLVFPFQFPSFPQVGVFVIYHYFPRVVSIFLTWSNGVPVSGKLADDPAPGFLLESVS